MVLLITDALGLFCAPSGPKKFDGIMKYQDISAQNMVVSARTLEHREIVNLIILYNPINNT